MEIYTTFWPLDGADDIGVNLLGKKKKGEHFRAAYTNAYDIRPTNVL